MKLLVTGNYDPSYNRTQILLNGLKSNKEIKIYEFPISSFKTLDKIQFRQLAQETDYIYLPPFTHPSVKKIKRLTNKPIIFDPLISKYLTKVFDYQQVSKYSPRAYKNYLKDKIPLQLADLIIADTQEHKKYFYQQFKINPKKIVVLPIGADIAQFKANKTTPSNQFKVGFYGGFIPLQGVGKIIEAAQLLQHEKDIEFNLIGTGFEFEKMKLFAQKLNLNNIKFLGWINYDELPIIINSFDICLGIFGDTPKTDLVIPNKIYHYAALNKCIISKETPAIKEIFTDKKNIILTDNKPTSIAKKILNLKNNKELRNKISKAGFNLIENHYNQEKIAKQFVEILKNFNS